MLPKDVFVEGESEVYNYKKVQSVIDSRLLYTGQVSQRQYEWGKAGDVILVDERDVPELLSKRLGKRLCCGNNISEGNIVFQAVE